MLPPFMKQSEGAAPLEGKTSKSSYALPWHAGSWLVEPCLMVIYGWLANGLSWLKRHILAGYCHYDGASWLAEGNSWRNCYESGWLGSKNIGFAEFLAWPSSAVPYNCVQFNMQQACTLSQLTN
jgi:hypothetical protein